MDLVGSEDPVTERLEHDLMTHKEPSAELNLDELDQQSGPVQYMGTTEPFYTPSVVKYINFQTVCPSPDTDRVQVQVRFFREPEPQHVLVLVDNKA